MEEIEELRSKMEAELREASRLKQVGHIKPVLRAGAGGAEIILGPGAGAENKF